MEHIWVVVADSSRARILSSDGDKGALEELADLVHPEARAHERNITSDLPGRAFDRMGEGRHAMDTPTSVKEQEAVYFAKAVAEHVEKGRTQGRFDKLVVAAAPAFLGLLRQQFSPSTQKLISVEVDKDLVQFSPQAVRDHLPAQL